MVHEWSRWISVEGFACIFGLLYKLHLLCSLCVIVAPLLFGSSSFVWCHLLSGCVIPRLADFNSVPTFLRSAINLQGKWRSHFAKTKPHCIVGVICLEVSAEIKNLPTYSVCFKAISSPVITHCLWSVRAMRAFQESKAASQIWFINFIQC